METDTVPTGSNRSAKIPAFALQQARLSSWQKIDDYVGASQRRKAESQRPTIMITNNSCRISQFFPLRQKHVGYR